MTSTTERIPGRAGAEATRALTARQPGPRASHGYTELGNTGLHVSRVGFGGYRIADTEGEHQEALAKALREGCNLIDTSTNYTGGHSEQLVGRVLSSSIAEGGLSRDEVVVVSKVGYVQGENLEHARQREIDGSPYPEMVKYGDTMWHCIHPEWIAAQLEHSLTRLGLDTVDVYLLHNPEYYLELAHKQGEGTLEDRRTEFYARLERAFAYLEEERERGRIAYYGVSSNTAVEPPDDSAATHLSRMLAAARNAGGSDHAFRVLQVPMNLLEPGALERTNCDEGGTRETPLAHARRHGVGVLINRPLNAITQGGLVRLADPPAAPHDTRPSHEPFERVRALEHEFERNIGPHLQAAGGEPLPARLFELAESLERIPSNVLTLAQWNDIEAQSVRPRVRQLVQAIDSGVQGELATTWQHWRSRYLQELDGLLGALRARATERSRAQADAVRSAIAPQLPEAHRDDPLSRLAIWTLASCPGVSTVLLGMRRPAYVDDALEVMGREPLPNPDAVLAAAKDASGDIPA